MPLAAAQSRQAEALGRLEAAMGHGTGRGRVGRSAYHDLRHSAASFMINAGIDLYAVGRILGHADHQSTMRYSHLANETLMAAVEAGAKKMQL